MFGFIGNFFSELLFNLIIPGLGLGILSLILSIFVPTSLSQYKIPLQLGGLVLVIFFVFTAGRFSEHKKYEAEAAQLRFEIAEQTAMANRISTDVIVQYVDRIKIVEKIKEVKVITYVTQEDDVACRIDPSTASRIRMLLNTSAKGQVPGTTQNPNAVSK